MLHLVNFVISHLFFMFSAVLSNRGFVQPLNEDHEEGSEAACRGSGEENVARVHQLQQRNNLGKLPPDFADASLDCLHQHLISELPFHRQSPRGLCFCQILETELRGLPNLAYMCLESPFLLI